VLFKPTANQQTNLVANYEIDLRPGVTITPSSTGVFSAKIDATQIALAGNGYTNSNISSGQVNCNCSSYTLNQTSKPLQQPNISSNFRKKGMVSSEISNFESVKIYPNPTSDVFTVELPNELINSNIHIFDQLGKLVYSYENLENLNKVQITENLVPGIYTIKIENDAMVSSNKLVVE